MSNISKLKTNPLSGFNIDNMTWNHLEGGSDFDYPIDYWIAILGSDPAPGARKLFR